MTDERELREFLETPPENIPPPAKRWALLKIRRDLVRNKLWFAVYFVALTLFGYFVSLSICEQHNLGFFVISRTVAELISQLPNLVCAGVCGALFTCIPFLLSRLFLNRFHQRFLLFRLWWLTLAIPIIAVLCLLAMPHLIGLGSSVHNHAEHVHTAVPNRDNIWMLVWGLSALVWPYFLEAVVYLAFLRGKR